MKTEESLYVRILGWAYRKGENGFRWDDLKSKFNLTKPQEQWVIETFRNKKEILGLLPYKTKVDEHIYGLTAEGISEAISYLSLKEVQKTGARAEKIAVAAIVIGAVVGLIQITVAICLR